MGLANLGYQVSDDILTYLTDSRAEVGRHQSHRASAGISPVVKSETVDSYQVGVKTSCWRAG